MKIHGLHNKEWRYYWGNQHLHYLNKNAPMIADDCIRACDGSSVNPWVLLSVAIVTSENFAAAPLDYFACGLEGPIEDQIINASLQYMSFDDTDQLRLTDTQKRIVEVVYREMTSWMERLAAAQKPQPLPQPEPEPEPIPPAKPPKPTPVELPPKKEDPKPPSQPGAWKITLAKIVGVLGAAGFIVKLFLPGAFASAYDLVLKILGLILGS